MHDVSYALGGWTGALLERSLTVCLTYCALLGHTQTMYDCVYFVLSTARYVLCVLRWTVCHTRGCLRWLRPLSRAPHLYLLSDFPLLSTNRCGHQSGESGLQEAGAVPTTSSTSGYIHTNTHHSHTALKTRTAHHARHTHSTLQTTHVTNSIQNSTHTDNTHRNTQHK